jgi:hypothetical protein
MRATHSASPDDDDPARNRRVRDGDSWLEAATRRRGDDGKFRHKRPNDPPSRLLFDDLDNLEEEAA